MKKKGICSMVNYIPVIDVVLPDPGELAEFRKKCGLSLRQASALSEIATPVGLGRIERDPTATRVVTLLRYVEFLKDYERNNRHN